VWGVLNDERQPKILALRHMLDEYLTFQEEIITKRTQYDLKKALDRQHVLEGLLIAEDNIDEVIKTIRESYDNAKERLMERFNLSEIQAQVVLDMQLKRLQGLEREKLEAEYEELEKRIAYYRELLSNEEMLKGVLKDELTAIRDKYGDDRLTEIQDVEDEIDIEDLIEEEQCVFTLSHAGYCKRVPASTYRSQKRGGRGVTGMTTKEEDFVEGVFTASTHDYILFFTNLGKVHRRKGYQIPEAGRTAKGTNLVNILPFEPGEKVTAGITVHEFDEDYLVFVTRNGTVKRLELGSLNTARKAGIRALTLSEGDELIAVMKTDGKQDILLASANGMVICFNENDVRVMGRDAAGVRGMMLDAGDYVVGAGIASQSYEATFLFQSKNGGWANEGRNRISRFLNQNPAGILNVCSRGVLRSNLRQGDDFSPNLLNTLTSPNLKYYHGKFIGLRADGAVTTRTNAIAARNDELYLKN